MNGIPTALPRKCLLFSSLICVFCLRLWFALNVSFRTQLPKHFPSWVSIHCMNSGGEKMGRDIAWRPWLKTQIALAGEMRWHFCGNKSSIILMSSAGWREARYAHVIRTEAGGKHREPKEGEETKRWLRRGMRDGTESCLFMRCWHDEIAP